MPGAGEEIQIRQHHRQTTLVTADILFELVAVIFHLVEAFIPDLAECPAAGDKVSDILFRDGNAGNPCHGKFDAAL